MTETLAAPYHTSYRSNRWYYHDVDIWPAMDHHSRSALVFVTGNPGLVSYYVPYLTLIYEKLEKKVTIISISLLGHTPGNEDFQNQLPNLENNVLSISSFLELLCSPNSILPFRDTTLYLMGHSIGSYIVLQAWKRCRLGVQLRVKHVYALFPTLSHMSKSSNYKHLHSFGFFSPFINSFLLPVIVFLLSLIPRWIIYYMVRILQPHMSVEAANVTVNLVQSVQSVRCALSLASEEMIHVNTPDLEWIREIKDHISFVYCPAEKDGWVPGWARQEILSVLEESWNSEGKSKMNGFSKKVGRFQFMTPEVPHAFCVNEEHYEEVAELVGAWLKQDVVEYSSEIVFEQKSVGEMAGTVDVDEE